MDKDIRPTILVIFGATGDLTRRKLMPALFNMYRRGVLPKKIGVIGFSRRKLSNEEFREMMMQRPHGNQEPRVDNPALSNLKSAIDSYRQRHPLFRDPGAPKTVPLPASVSADKQSRKEKVLGESSALRLRLEELAQTTDSLKNLSHGSSSRVPAACSSTQTSNFAKLLSYVKGDFTKKEGYKELKGALGKQDKEWEVCANKLFYLAAPPKYYEVILENLGRSGLTEECGRESPRKNFEGQNFVRGWTRIILEKPFGKDLKSAKALDKRLGELFGEEQIFRIDHYLGKESLQNILAFRFWNAIFEPVWNKDYIDNIQIIASEKLGLEGRVTFYDKVGALRDMVQSHLLQMVAAVASGKPRDYSAEGIRDERVKVLRALKFKEPAGVTFFSSSNSQSSGVTLEDTPADSGNIKTVSKNKPFSSVRPFRSVLAQASDNSKNAHAAGSPGPSSSRAAAVVKGQYRGYKEEKGVDGNSVTETFAALRLFIDNKRWEGVPFYLLTGKKLKKDITRIVVEFSAKPARSKFYEELPVTKFSSEVNSPPQVQRRSAPFFKDARKDSSSCTLPSQTNTDSKKISTADSSKPSSPNRIIFEMKPNKCISIEVNMKEPGLEMRAAPHKLQLDYGKVHGHKLLAPYGRLVLDCMLGDQTLFARTDGVLASWKFIEKIKGIWDRGDLKIYEPGSWGPKGAEELIRRDGRKWYLCVNK